MRRFAILLACAGLAACGLPPAAAHTAYVSDEQANVVHVIDGASGREVERIPTGKRPRGLEVSPDGRTLYVAASNDNRIEAIDLKTRRVVRHLASGPDPERFAVSPDGRTLYVANEDDAKVSFLDVAGNRVLREVEVGPEPEGMAVSPDGRWVVCTSEAASLAHIIDARTGELVASVLVGARPRDARFTPDSRQVWVTSESRATLTLIEVPSGAIVQTLDFRKAEPPENVQAVGLALSRNGHRLFVALGRGNHVAEVDPASLKVLRYLKAGFRNWGVALSPDETRLYAANGLSGDVTLIDLTTGRSRTLRTGGRPWGVVTTP
jgi:PQQ-dependent catabolism-associated beta-propeller protein